MEIFCILSERSDSCRDNEELILDHNGRDDTVANGAIIRNIRYILMRRDAELSIHNRTVLGTNIRAGICISYRVPKDAGSILIT